MGAAGEQFDFLTNEAVEGETLADRLLRGSLSVQEGLRCAIQIGGILNSAHSRGLVHGCLSPACIALTNAGPRVLRPPDTAVARRAEYRSPEQVRGEAPGCLSDIFAFGALLFEMITGRCAFGGSAEELDRAILDSTPAWSGPGFSVPAALQETIASLLAKDPLRRRQRIQNAVIELKLAARPSPRITANRRQFHIAAGPQSSRLAVGPLSRRFVAATCALVALAAVAVAAVVLLDRRISSPVFKFTVAAPERAAYIGGPALSPGGSHVAFSAIGPGGKRMLWLRSLDALHAAAIPGTEGGSDPFWSPDGQSIGFFANGSLRKVGRLGEGPLTICSAGEPAGGGAWNRDGLIVFAPGLATGIYRVSAGGGTPQPLLEPDSSKRERSFLWPKFLPDGAHFLFFNLSETPETTGVYAGSLDGAAPRMLFRSDANAVYASSGGLDPAGGYVLFMKDGNLVGQALDPSRLILQGDPVTLANDIDTLASLSLIPVSASNNGVLAYQSVGERTRQLVWVDRNGGQLGIAAEPGDYGIPRFSADGSRVAVEKFASNGQHTEVWLLNTEGGAKQFTLASSGSRSSPVWSPDGSRILFGDNRDGVSNIYSKDARAMGAEELIFLRSAFSMRPTDWSRDGKYVLLDSVGADNRSHVWALSLLRRQATSIVNTGHEDDGATLSPDGKWVAYQSDESGAPEVYVQPFEGLGGSTSGRRRASSGGGGLPRWSRDGAELYYVTSMGYLMSVAVRFAGGNPEFASPRALFRTRQLAKTWNSFDVSPDGQRFVVNVPLEDSTSSPITIVTNWTGKLKN